jgi:hypothetical protein
MISPTFMGGFNIWKFFKHDFQDFKTFEKVMINY